MNMLAKSSQPVASSVPIVHWSFERANRVVECEVDFNRARGSFEVKVVPHGVNVHASVERFDRAGLALQRHAELVDYLRGNGWRVARYSA